MIRFDRKELLLCRPPRVSIIVPAYNAQKTIVYCLRSICTQTYSNLEILVLNDGSKDNTLALCRQLAAEDARIRVIDKPNSGVSDTRNQGLALAQGKYVQFVDNDDCLLPDFTEKLVHAAEANQADLVIAPLWLIYPAGFVDYQRWWEKLVAPFLKRNPPQTRLYGFLQSGIYTGEAYARRLIEKPFSLFYAAVWNKLYRRDTIATHSVQFPLDGYSEDLHFNALYLPHVHKVVSITSPGYGYLQNSYSISHSTITNRDMLQIRRRTLHDYSVAYRQMGLYAACRWRIWMSVFGENEFTLKSELPQEPIPLIFRTLFGAE